MGGGRIVAILDSRVIALDEEGQEVDVVLEYDHEENLYDNGETTTTFYSGEDIYLLAQLPPGYSITNIKSNSGRVVNLGLVERVIEVSNQFFPDTEEGTLAWLPNSGLTITDVHLQSPAPTLAAEDKKVTCSNPPAVVDYSYRFSAYSLRAEHPADMDIEEDENFPLGIVLEVTR